MKQNRLNLEAWMVKQVKDKRELVDEAVKHGTYFRSARSEGYKHRGRTFVMHEWTGWIRGPEYFPNDCRCIPWEECACGLLYLSALEQQHMRSIAREGR